ncbi:MFS transporter [Nocardiopsis exhalans]|uniref:MFS transporter n=1 Tax=Nocardiopsis exhalans TaxID=163604 RepID=A0ABY5D1P2_9ACTN|nr:MFS transporter [Nocardiopsis exhalans]USY17051.1 MFS transporter [Nocardiopsis exhalans]
MTTQSTREPHTRLSRLTWPLYTYALFEEFILLYPLYALFFTEHGLSVAQISSLFVLWSLTSVLLAIPAGAWADIVPRRYLLAAAPLLSGTGFALWLLFPSYWVFALGFVLWGTAGALASGAFEALVYTELSRRGAAQQYARVMGVTRALGVAAVGVATLLAVPVMAHGGYTAIGLASVAACLLCALAGLALPEHRAPRSDAADRGSAPEEGSGPGLGYLQTMRLGLAEARGSRAVRDALILLVVITAFWGMLEEYVPLLAASAGVTTDDVPLVVLTVWVCVTLGGLLAGPAARLSPRTLGSLLALAAAAIAVGALLGNPLGWVLLGCGFGVCQMMNVVADARLQDSITGSSRATVTSLAEVGAESVSVVSFPLYAGVFLVLGHGTAFVLFAAPYLLAAVLMARTRGTRPVPTAD